MKNTPHIQGLARLASGARVPFRIFDKAVITCQVTRSQVGGNPEKEKTKIDPFLKRKIILD
ncbi:MAG: hypothetical protein WAW22_06975 [Smithellaceae bacterium]|jgi:hypothetical protein